MEETEFKSSWYLSNETVYEFWSFISDIFTEAELDDIIKAGLGGKPRATEIKDGVIDGNNKNYDIRKSSVSWLNSTSSDNARIYQTLTGVINHMNDKFFQYDLFRLESLQFTRYDSSESEFYGRHTDMLAKSHGFQRKLSFSVLLSDPADYEGGDLVFHYQTDPAYAPKDRGTIVFFPSSLLHEVTPVTKGVRYSLVGWIHGPNFR